MIILGSSNDDRGQQLEAFTKLVLTKLGYSDIVANSIGSGGHEIDVRAKYSIPHPGGQSTSVAVICECKAKRDPVDTSEWMKFLGKILVTRLSASSDVHGMLVALNGINGNVAGGYEDLRTKDTTISVLYGERLLASLREAFELPDREKISQHLKRFTQRTWAKIDPAFNSGRIYWIITFEDSSCTLLTAVGEPATGNELVRLKDSVLIESGSKEFLDLNAEAMALDRIKKLSVELLIEACENGFVAVNKSPNTDWTEIEQTAAVSELSKRGLLDSAGESQWHPQLGINGSRNETELFAKRFLFLLHSGIHSDQLIRLARCLNHDRFLNQQLLDFISECQGNVPLPEEHRAWILDILRIFPNALAYALTPDPVIVTHRKATHQTDARMDKADFVRFANEVMRCAEADFSAPSLGKYLHETRNIRELDITRRVVLKGAKASMHTIEVRNRTAVGQVAENLGGGYLHILVFNDSPEPWDWTTAAEDAKKSQI